MKTLLVAAVLALLAVPTFAAIRYEFVQKNTSDDSVSPSTDLNARATVDGERSRIDFLGGTLYPPGTYVISTDGSRRMFFVDPAKQWYTEFNAASVATSLGASGIRIQNQKSSFDKPGDRLVIAGIEAEHFRVTLSYDITVTMKGLPLTQRVQTDIDTWTTPKFGDVLDTAMAGVERTGNAELDRLLEAETAKVRGLPLRQTVTTRTTFDLPAASRSELKIPPTRTMIRETWVTRVDEVTADPAMFRIPGTYRRADTPAAPAGAAETLTFDPPSK